MFRMNEMHNRIATGMIVATMMGALSGCDEPLDEATLAALDAEAELEEGEDGPDELTAAIDPSAVAAYFCNIDTVSAIHNCNAAIIAPSNAGGGRWTATATMNSGNNYRRMDVFAEICNPTGWWLHIGDSPTNDGYGGDGASTDHDAEGYIKDLDFQFFSTYDFSRSKIIQSEWSRDAVGGGCRVVQMTAFHEAGANESAFRFDGGVGRIDVTSIAGLRLGYSACGAAGSTQRSIECDWEDAARTHQHKWHVGINRMVTNASRVGSGVQKVCVRVSTDVNTTPASCIGPVAPPPPPPPPGGGGGGGGGCLIEPCPIQEVY